MQTRNTYAVLPAGFTVFLPYIICTPINSDMNRMNRGTTPSYYIYLIYFTLLWVKCQEIFSIFFVFFEVFGIIPTITTTGCYVVFFTHKSTKKQTVVDTLNGATRMR